MQAKAFLSLLKQAYADWTEDKASRLAAALAYYTALSLAPMIVLGVLLLKFLDMDGQKIIEEQMAMMMGNSGKEMATEMITNAKASSGWLAGTISFLVLIWGASYVFAELQDSMNTVWEVQPKPNMGWWAMVKKRFLSMAMVLGIGFLLLTSLFVSTLMGALVHRIAGDGKVVGFLLDAVSTLVLTGIFFSAIFKLLPDVKIQWRDVLAGAVLTAVLFTIGKYLLTWYLTQGSTKSAYGAAGSLAAVLIWVYYSAWIMFFGAEFTHSYVAKYGRKLEPDEDAIPVTEEQRAQQGLLREHDKSQAASGVAALAGKRGAAYPREAVPDRRVVTITRPTHEARKAYAVAGVGLATGFLVGAVGMLTGRKFKGAGLQELALNERLERLEQRYGRGRTMRAHALELDVKERLDALDARHRHAQDALRRRAKYQAKPGLLDRLSELVGKS